MKDGLADARTSRSRNLVPSAQTGYCRLRICDLRVWMKNLGLFVPDRPTDYSRRETGQGLALILDSGQALFLHCVCPENCFGSRMICCRDPMSGW